MIPSTQSDESPSIPEPIYESDQTVKLNTTLFPADPYPEDNAPVEREAASLRLPLFQSRSESLERGVIIGVERARTLHDLAIVSTLLAAAPFQPVRRKHRGVKDHRFLISPTDLRSYRRESVTEQMLVLLIDYTSLRDCEWQQALLPYLHQAYTERASICIVQVGTVEATYELQAELVRARSILVPTISAALEAKRGKATPLAHGFDLALHTLRKSLEHGRNTIRRALFVIISDGRGNIPLSASRRRQIIQPISHEGIEDTLQLARQIGELKNVQNILLNPQPRFYPDLPLILAQSLKAEVKNIQHLGRMEFEHD